MAIHDVIKKIPILNKLKLSQLAYSNIKSICVFGIKADQVLITTHNDEVYAYGNNSNGCLGLGPITTTTVYHITNVPQLFNKQVIDFAYGYNHVIALSKTGRLYVWGNNGNGELGNGSLNSCYVPEICGELRGKNVLKVCCGSYHSMALTECGKLYCWGLNRFGQIGNDTNVTQRSPIDISSSIESKIVSISCGCYFSLALTETGVVYSWGTNEYGQLGIGNNMRQSVPTCIASLININIQEIGCGASYAVLLSSDGDVYSFGYNYFGQLGIGSRRSENVPQKLNISERCVKIALSIYNEFCAVQTECGQFLVWGKCGDDQHIISEPILYSDCESFHEIYVAYSEAKRTYKPIIFDDFFSDKRKV